MLPDDFNYTATYAGMEDDELLEIYRDSVDLVDAAKTALRQEMEKRGLKPEEGKAEGAGS